MFLEGEPGLCASEWAARSGEKSGDWGPVEVGEGRRKRKKGEGCTDYSGVYTGRKRRAHTICWTVCWAQGVEELWSPLCGAC